MSWQLVVFDGALQENFYFDKEQRSCRLCSAQKASTHTRVDHADLFADAHRCGYPHYPTYVGKSEAKIESESDIFLQILSEKIEFQENGSRGINLAQISN